MEGDRREHRRQEPAALAADPLHRDAEETIERALRLLYLLPPSSLDRREQNQLRATLVPDSSRLVYAVVRALQRLGPELPEVSEDPADLRALQERADRLAELRGHLEALRLRADEAHLRAQGLAVRRARAVVQRLADGASLLPDGSPEQRLRRTVIARAAHFDLRSTLPPLREDL